MNGCMREGGCDEMGSSTASCMVCTCMGDQDEKTNKRQSQEEKVKATSGVVILFSFFLFIEMFRYLRLHCVERRGSFQVETVATMFGGVVSEIDMSYLMVVYFSFNLFISFRL